jgi:hypothetical protein
MKTKPLKLSATQIANYVRLHCCDRYLWNLKNAASGKNEAGKVPEEKTCETCNLKSTEVASTSESEPGLDPYLKSIGDAHENEFRKQLTDTNGKLNLTSLCCSVKSCARDGDPLTCFLEKTENGFCCEVTISGEIEGVTVSGRIDFLARISGTIHIIECKASMQDKTYQRIQAAIYALLLEPKLTDHNKPPTSVMVVRRNAKGELHTYKLDGGKLILDPEAQKDEHDDAEGNLPRPHIDGAELAALKADITTICKKFADMNGNPPGFQLLPRCHDCEFNTKCLGDAKANAKDSNGGFGYEILTYGAKAKGLFHGDCKTLDCIGNQTDTPLHPPPAKLVPVRKAYYELNGSGEEVAKIDGRVPDLPDPDSRGNNPFFQFFLCVEGDMTTQGRLGALSLNTVKYPPTPGAASTGSPHCWTKWRDENGTHTELEILTALVKQISTDIKDTEPFYAHFYFWSIEEKKLLAQACERVIKENACDDNCLIKRLLHWISRHEYLREPEKENGNYKTDNESGLPVWPDPPTNQEELVCTQLSQEIRRCFAIGSIGQTLLEVSCLKWKNGSELTTWEPEWCANIVALILEETPQGSANNCALTCTAPSPQSICSKLKNKMLFSDTLPPSVWLDERPNGYPTKDAIECYFKKRVQILAKLEQHIRSSVFNDEKEKQHFQSITSEKVRNDVFPTFQDENLVQATRNMLLIETMHRKDRWLKEVTDGFEEMKTKHRAVELTADPSPQWRVFPKKKKNNRNA